MIYGRNRKRSLQENTGKRGNNMAQLRGGRFTKETDKLVYNFNASIGFDQMFFHQDVQGSKAHVTMRAKQGILTEEEKNQIIAGLNSIVADVDAGKLEITSEYEDIHSFVEATLIDRIGDPGKKLHTGRSRNDQVALDMKLFTRDEIHEIDAQLKELLEVIRYIRGPIEMLVELTARFKKQFGEAKREKNILDFTDMEHFALQILMTKEGEEIHMSQAARELSAKYDEVLVDEYQDSNLVQELLTTAVSGWINQKKNIFMVGDVKQSIYSFRMARPDLFMDKYHSYSD